VGALRRTGPGAHAPASPRPPLSRPRRARSYAAAGDTVLQNEVQGTARRGATDSKVFAVSAATASGAWPSMGAPALLSSVCYCCRCSGQAPEARCVAGAPLLLAACARPLAFLLAAAQDPPALSPLSPCIPPCPKVAETKKVSQVDSDTRNTLNGLYAHGSVDAAAAAGSPYRAAKEAASYASITM
jgi:hypothetical protein